MADYNAEELATVQEDDATPDAAPAESLFQGEAPIPVGTDYFKMRADGDPGPGYEVWVVTTSPDFTGAFAPAPILAGTASVISEWNG